MMSAERARRRAYARRRAKIALKAGRAQGCTCKPSVRVEWSPGGAWRCAPWRTTTGARSCASWSSVVRTPTRALQFVLDPSGRYEEAP